jgi:GntR family transcriptional regulator
MRDEAPGLKRRLISREETRVPKDLVQELGINPEDPCLVVQRLDELNESPLAFDTGWIPITYAEGIMDPLLIRVDFLEAWVKAARIELSHMRQTVEAVEANKTEAKLLEIPINSPLLMTIETFYNRQGNAVGSFKSRYRSDRIRLVTQHSCERNSGKEW